LDAYKGGGTKKFEYKIYQDAPGRGIYFNRIDTKAAQGISERDLAISGGIFEARSTPSTRAFAAGISPV